MEAVVHRAAYLLKEQGQENLAKLLMQAFDEKNTEIRALHDELAMMHTMSTDSYGRREPTEQSGD